VQGGLIKVSQNVMVCNLINVLVCPENAKGVYMSNFARKHLAPVQGMQVAASQDRVDAYKVPETRAIALHPSLKHAHPCVWYHGTRPCQNRPTMLTNVTRVHGRSSA
jgi:hypothetical protein